MVRSLFFCLSAHSKKKMYPVLYARLHRQASWGLCELHDRQPEREGRVARDYVIHILVRRIDAVTFFGGNARARPAEQLGAARERQSVHFIDAPNQCCHGVNSTRSHWMFGTMKLVCTMQ